MHGLSADKYVLDAFLYRKLEERYIFVGSEEKGALRWCMHDVTRSRTAFVD